MANTHTPSSLARKNPAQVGVFAVLGTIALGVTAGFVFGYTKPAETFAIAPVIITAPVVPVAPILPPPIVPVVPITPIVTPIAPVTIVASTNPDTTSTQAPSATDAGTDTSTVVAPVTVTASNSDSDTHTDVPATDAGTTLSGLTITPTGGDTDTHTAPCCTNSTPPTIDTTPVVSGVTITPTDSDSDTHTAPCCTNSTPPTIDTTPVVSGVTITPTGTDTDTHTAPCCTEVVTPPVPVTPIPPDTDTHTAPCCTVTVDVPPTVTPPPVTPPVVPPPPVTPPTTPPVASCTLLTATPSLINPGDAVTLAWQTDNATSITIDQGVGSQTPVAAGSTIVHPTTDTTYTATVTGAANSVTCTASVHITTSHTTPVPACVQLTATPGTINAGDAVTLTWVTSNASSTSIDNNIGVVTPTDTGSVVVHPTADTVYTATVNGTITIPACQAKVVIQTGGGGCTSDCGSGGCTTNCGGGGCTTGCGGGGGGGPRTPNVSLSSDKPLGFVYLSQIPYTGLDLGTWGTALYWLALIGWSAALAYLVLFNAVPFAFARVKRFSGEVKQALDTPVPQHEAVVHEDPVIAQHVAAILQESHAHTEAAHSTHDTHAAPAPAASGFSAYQGFRSFGAETLTIDDLVKGLARTAEAAPAASAYNLRVEEPKHEAPAPVVAAPVVTVEVPKEAAPAAPVHPEVPHFIQALIHGERDTVFTIVRAMTRAGEDVEAFLAHVTFALDDAYRARIEGTPVHAEIARVTAECHPSFLERMVSSLATAIDGSYTSGTTGTKLALTRALAVAGA